jgi:hypothetical protein
MYNIISRDFKSGILLTKFSVNNYLEALSLVEALAYDFIEAKEGINNYKIYNKSLSGQFGKVPYGYCICKSRNKYLKLTIFQKELIKGILYNSWKMTKIISFQILEPEKKNESELFRPETDEFRIQEKIIKWNTIHSDMRSAVSKRKFFPN